MMMINMTTFTAIVAFILPSTFLNGIKIELTHRRHFEDMIYLQGQGPKWLIPRAIRACFLMPQPRGHTCTVPGLQKIVVAIAFYHIELASSLLSIHHPLISTAVCPAVCFLSSIFHLFLPPVIQIPCSPLY